MSPTLLHVFPTFRVGGAQIRFAALANHFGAEFRHVIVAMDGHIDCRDRLDSSLALSFPKIDLRKRDTFGDIRRFRALLRATEASRLITYNWGAIECAMANWPGLLHHIHVEDGFGPEEAERQLPRRVWTRRLVLARSTVVLPSRLLYGLASEVWKLKPSTLRYIPNGIDCGRFERPAFPALSWPGEGPVIGTVAALRREKNLERLLGAFALVRRQRTCRLVIAGDGPVRSALEQRTHAMGIAADVHFTGYLAETERVYAGLDVFALSSDTEQMPTSVIEAMAAGLPVATTKVGDVADMVSAENLPFVVAPDIDALAGAIERLLKDAALRKTVGAANQAIARSKFGEEAMFAAYRGLFTDA